MGPEDVKETDYGSDVADVESHAVGTHFDPHTGKRLKRPVRIALIVLGVLFLAACLVAISWIFKTGYRLKT